MKNNKKHCRISQAIKNTGASSSELISLVIILALITTLTLISIQVLKNKFQRDIQGTLTNVLNITKEGFIHEENKQLNAVQAHTNSTAFVAITEALLANQSNVTTSAYQHSLARLRHYFNLDLIEKKHLGFYIIAPGNINIATAENDDLGEQNLLFSQPDLLRKLWSGEPSLTRIQRNDISITDEHGRPVSNPATMFAGAPIRNKKNEVIALLTLRINPYNELFPLLEKEHLGETGETYAFDKNGLMLSHSRFESELEEQNLLEKLATKDHAIRLYDPGSNLIEHPNSGDEIKPVFTEMAQSAMRGESGSNVKGYRDYRGVNVVGAWHWFPEVDIGITSEQDVSDAYSTFYYVRKLVFAVSGIICLLIILLFAITAIKRRKIKASEAYLDAIYKTSIDALIIINNRGIIQRCNPTTEELFGYSNAELVGQNVRMLMPDPHRSEHDGYLDSYQKSGTAKPETTVIGAIREYEAIKADGTLFPIELNVNPLELSTEILFAGSIRDISKRKQAQQLAHDSKQHLVNTLKNAHVGTWDWSKETQSMSYTGSTDYLYGLAPEGTVEILTRKSKEFIKCIHPDDRDMVKNAVNTANDTSGIFNIEYRVVWPDGSIHWIHSKGNVVFNDHGRPTNTMGILQDITERKNLEHEIKKTEDALVETKNNLVNILNTAPVNIFIKNLKGEYTFVNPAWEKCLNKTSDEVIGKTVFDILPEKTAERFHSNQQIVIETGASVQLEEEFINTDGQYTAFMTSIFPLKDTEGEIYAVGGWSSIITEIKQAQKELEDARRNADASNQAKSYFLASMSHEIRTPMNGVVGIIDVLRYTTLDEQQQHLVKTISDSALSLLAIIDDILDFSKVDAGKTELEEIPISLEEIVDGVGETLLPLSTKKGVELITFCEPNLPNVYGDAGRIRQILYNIGGNAIKFTGGDSEHGRVIIRCATEKSTPDNNLIHIQLKIEDNGIGMPPETQKDLFNPFSQAETSTTRKYGGTGLGLAISKSLCELMGGEIEVVSEVGKGSMFTVSIPLKLVEPGTTFVDTNILQGKDVLLVKRSDTVNEILATYLHSASIQLHEIDSNDISELASIDSNPPSELVIVIDTEGKDNETNTIKAVFKQRFKSIDRLNFVTISRGMRRQARMQGNDTMQLDLNCLSKRVFLQTVASAAGLISPDVANLEDNDSLPAPPLSSLFSADKSQYLLLVAEDNPINQRVITHQLNLLGLASEIADDGQEALDMWLKSKGKYSLLLSDCHMPNMDGYTLATSIRQHENEGEHIPIIALTADAMEGAKKVCINAGMDDYITKPLQIDTLSKKLSEWLPDNLESQEELTVTPDTTSDSATIDTSDAVAVDAKILPELLQSDDPSLLAEFYHEFLKSATEIFEDISRAAEENNLKKVSSEAHKLKSSSYTVGANVLADCCLLLETSGKLGEGEVVKKNIEPLASFLKQVKAWVYEHHPNN